MKKMRKLLASIMVLFLLLSNLSPSVLAAELTEENMEETVVVIEEKEDAVVLSDMEESIVETEAPADGSVVEVQETYINPLYPMSTVGYTPEDGSGYEYIQDGLVYWIEGEEATVTGYTGTPTNVVIPETVDGNPVTVIGEKAFSECKSLVKIELPKTLEKIADGQIYEYIDEVVYGEGAFWKCTSLKEIVIPSDSKLEYIGNCAFLGCNKLTSITLPTSIRTLAISSFEDCASLTSLELPEGLTVIEKSALSNTGIKELKLPVTLKEFDEVTCLPELEAFFVADGNSVFKAEDGVLYRWGNWTDTNGEIQTGWGLWYYPGSKKGNTYTVPNNVGFVNSSSLTYRNLQYLETIDLNMSCGSSGECLVKVNDNNPYLCVQNDMLCSKDGKTLLRIPVHLTGIVTVPKGITTIESQAAVNCQFSKIDLPEGLEYIGGACFTDCKNLESVTIPSTVQFFDGRYAFQGCKQLKSVDIPEGALTTIGLNMFLFCESLEEIHLPDGVREIYFQAFSGCSALKEIELPDSLEIIGYAAFNGCKSLEWITLPDGLKSIDSAAFSETGLGSIEIPTSVEWIAEDAFSNMPYFVIFGERGSYAEEYANTENPYNYFAFWPIDVNEISGTCGDNLSWVLTRDGVLTITGQGEMVDFTGKDAPWFFYHSMVKEIHLDESITTIGDFAFWQCLNVKDITIPENVTRIGRSAYDGCENIERVVIPASIADIGDFAFAYCHSLVEVTFSGDAPDFGDRPFMDCRSPITIYYLPNKWDEDYIQNLKDSYGDNITWVPMDISNSCAIPEISKVENVNGGVNITWGKVAGAEKYRVFYRTNVNSGWTKLTDTTETSYTWSGATSGTTYTFTVRCITDDGKYYTSNYNATGKSITYIAAPVITSLSNVSNGVQVNWGKVTGAEKYRVYYKTGSGSWTKIADTTATSYTWTGAKTGTTYAFTVRCINSAATAFTSSYDSIGKSITYTASSLATPSISSVSNVNGGVQITWGKVAGAEKYRIYYKTGSGNWTKIADTTATSYMWTGAKSGTTYAFTVRCINNEATAFTSSYDSTGKSITYVAAPVISSLTNVSNGVQINWGKVTGAEKYRVYYKTGSGSWTKITDTTETSYTWTGAKTGTSYAFTVRCINSTATAFTSSYDSTGKSITYTSGTLATPKISSVGNVANGVQITWGAVSGAEMYRVFYRTSVNSGWTKLVDTAATNYTWTGAKSGTTYIFTVRCISSDGKTYTSNYDATGRSIDYIAAPKISGVSNAGNGVQISWGKVDGAEKYRVFYRTSANSSWTKLADTTSTSYIWSGAKSGTTYIFTVRCINSEATTYTSGYNATGTSYEYIK